MDDSHKLEWKIYWAFRNGDYGLSAELLAFFWTTDCVSSLKLDNVKGNYNDTLLHLACQNGWLDYVKLLIEEFGCEAEVKDCGNQSPLHYACHHGHLNIVRYLTRVHNCDIAVATRDHWTPLHYACRYGHLNIVEYILDIPGVTSRKQLLHVACKYSNDKFLELFNLMDKQSNPTSIEPLSILLQIACSFDQVQIVQYLCNKYGSHRYLNDTEIRLFIFCCKYGLLEIVTKLRVNVSDHTDTLGKSGLHYACQEGHVSTAKYLIEVCGCDTSKVDRNGYTPLHLACQHSHNIDMVKYMLHRSKGTLAWIEALYLIFSRKQWSDSQCIDLIKLLISTNKWKPTSTYNSNGDTALHLSIKHNRPDVAHFLLFESDVQIDPNIINLKQETPLKQASNPEIIRYFICQERVILDDELVDRLLSDSTQTQESVCIEALKLMAKNRQWGPDWSCNSKGDTALHLSARYCRPVVARFLLLSEHCNPNIKNGNGVTPLDLATNLEIISLLVNDERVQSKRGNAIIKNVITHSTNAQDSLCIDIIKTLTEAGQWNPSLSCNSNGDTALHLSIRLHRTALTNFLLSELNCDPSVKNLKGETPIEVIIELCSDSECLNFITAAKRWNLNYFCNSKGDTALHLSAWYCRPKLTNFLISFEAGCQPNVKNQAGETPLCLLLSISGWRDSDCINLIKSLIATKQWDPNSACDSDGNTVLHLAALYRRPAVVEFMLSETTCNPNIRNIEGETSLSFMPMWSDSESVSIIKLLITIKKWDPNSVYNSQNDTALHLAARHYKYKAVDFLMLQAKCDPYIRNKGGETPIHLILSTWSDNECFDIIKDIIATKLLDPISRCNSEGDTALHLAARNHRPKTLNYLLCEAKCDPFVRNKGGETPIHLILSTRSDNKCLDIMKDIVAFKQWDSNSMHNSEGDTALHLSARYHKPRVTQFLLFEAKCDPNIRNSMLQTPIELMISTVNMWSDSECADLIKALLATKQWDPNSNCNSKGHTALHLSAKNHKPKTTNVLLSEAKCDSYVRNQHGETPLHLILSIWSDTECYDIIRDIAITKQWDPNSRCNSEDDTALHLSVRYHKPRVTQFLISEAKCDPNTKNKMGQTPIDLLICTANMWSDSECVDIIKPLLASKQWDPNVTNNSTGDTALHFAARYYRPKTMDLLLSEAKCDPNIGNKRDETSINLIISRWPDSKCSDTIRDIVVAKQWNSNSRCNFEGDTALHLSIRHHKHRVAQFLISEAKCDPNIRNKTGETPIELLISDTNMWYDSECVEIINALVKTKQWDPNSRCNSKDDTALHLSARYHKPRVTQFLLSEAKCDPNIRNSMLQTPIELMISTANMWSDSECADLIKALLATKQWDPNSNCNSKGHTALHLSAKNHKPKTTNVLLSEAKCDSYVRNQHGETPLHLILSIWSDTECYDIIRDIAVTKQWDPNSRCNSKDDTALHLSVRYHKPRVTQFLISEAKCDPNTKNKMGQTPIDLLICTANMWSDSECVDIIKPLLASKQWDPNVTNNSTGDTALHFAARYYRPKTMDLLLSEAKCDPNIGNKRDETSINLIISRWPDSKCSDTIRDIVVAKQWNSNSRCNFEGDTALHLSIRHHKHRVAQFLISEAKCDPNIRNKTGETPIELLISDTNMWSDSECADLIKALLATGQWDPNSNCNSKGDTALHLSARNHKPKITNLLLSETKCDSYVRNQCSETPLHLILSIWSDTECYDIIRDIVVTKQWDPNLKCNSEDDTALHLSARYHKPRVTQFLLSEAKCDPNIRNYTGETPIQLLVSNIDMWSDSECTDIIKALVATKQWDLNSNCNSKGDTALHLSARNNRPRVVHYLLSETKCDPNSKNSDDETPLQLALSTDIINDLIRYGSNPHNVYKLYGKSLRLKEPLRPQIKVFIIGNSGVGKSTLTEALKTEASLFTKAFSKSRKVSGVDEKTAGIVPQNFKSKKYGHVTFYDFAGHREFYSSHAAFLHNVIQGSSPIFLLVVDMSDENDIIQQNILYWLSFIENQCSTVNCTSHVIIIGSHADIVLDCGDDPQQKAMEMSELIKKIFQSSIVEFIGIYPMDCQFPESPGMTKLRHCLIDVCNAVRIPEVIPFNAHCFHVFLLDKFRTSIAVTIQEILDQIMKEQDMKEGIIRFLPDTSTSICRVCDELNNRGHILFLKSSNTTEISWVIIDKACLLSEVTGTIFAPKDFKQHCQLAESTGVVPLSRFTEHFPNLKLEILIGFMTHLEFCREILDSDLLELIMKHQESMNKTDTFISDSERYFLFPGLITQQAPNNLWEHSQDFKYHCGWILQCTHPDQFFTSRLLQVLLLRLAFSFALVKVEVNESIPAFQRECSIWKNGIFWGEIFGMEAIVEVHSSNKKIVFQSRCLKKSLLHCIAQRSQVIRKILQCVHDFCPQIKITESFIDPSEATKFPIELSKLPQYTVQKIAEAIINSNDCYPLSVVSSIRIIPLHRLLTFEPYAEIGLSTLKHLYSDHVKKLSGQELETLSLNLSKKSDLFVKIFGLTSQSATVPPPTPEEFLTILQRWRDGCEGIYKCLKQKLDQYSIFAGRNIVELSRVSIQLQGDDTDDTHDNQDQTLLEISIPSPIISTNYKPLQELPDCDEIDEDETSSLSSYETATELHTNYYDSEEGDMDIIQLDHKPKLSELQLLKGCGGRRVRVIEGVASKWEDLATTLNFDGNRIDIIRRDSHYQSEGACRRMLIKWQDGDHDLKGPVTWATLIQCLIDAGLVDIANRLKELIAS